jgi:polar amino acid transport system permease protein
MLSADIITHLVTWTPFLLEGFGWNILIATMAAAMGTAVGACLVWMQRKGSQFAQGASAFLSNIFYKIPTLALMFYCAVLLPNEFQLPWSEQTYLFPNWVKAALALSAAQVGFTAQNLGPSLKYWGQGQHGAALLFIPNWGSNLLITIIASSSASLVGVSEIVSRCNKVIAATDNTALMVPMYLYASLFFLLFCFPLTLAMKKFKHVLFQRMNVQKSATVLPDQATQQD